MSGPFPGSKVQQPVYHGTNRSFTRLSIKHSAQGLIWFASDRAGVESGAHGNPTGITLELYVDLQRPAGWVEYQKQGLWELKRNGFDGAVLPEGDGFTGFVFSSRQTRIVARHRTAKTVIEALVPLPAARRGYMGGAGSHGQFVGAPVEDVIATDHSELGVRRRRWRWAAGAPDTIFWTDTRSGDDEFGDFRDEVAHWVAKRTGNSVARHRFFPEGWQTWRDRVGASELASRSPTPVTEATALPTTMYHLTDDADSHSSTLLFPSPAACCLVWDNDRKPVVLYEPPDAMVESRYLSNGGFKGTEAEIRAWAEGRTLTGPLYHYSDSREAVLHDGFKMKLRDGIYFMDDPGTLAGWKSDVANRPIVAYIAGPIANTATLKLTDEQRAQVIDEFGTDDLATLTEVDTLGDFLRSLEFAGWTDGTQHAALDPDAVAILDDAPVTEALAGARGRVDFTDALGHVTAYPMLISRNTIPGEKPYRLTFFYPHNPTMPADHLQLDSPDVAAAQAVLRGCKAWMCDAESATIVTESHDAARDTVDEFRAWANGEPGLEFDVSPWKSDPIVDVGWLGAKPRGTGIGERALSHLCALADKHGVVLQLEVGGEGSDAGRLIPWYQRHGFVGMAGYMQRDPGFLAEATDDFTPWFAGSQVADEFGRPRRVYHGTNQDFDEFSRGRAGQATKMSSSRVGFFFTDDPQTASEYADLAAERVIPDVSGHNRRVAQLKRNYDRLERLAQRSGNDQHWRWAHDALEKWEKTETDALQAEPTGANVRPVYLQLRNPLVIDAAGGVMSAGDVMRASTKAKRGGHDGLVIKALRDAPKAGHPSTHYVVFHPDQVRTAVGAHVTEGGTLGRCCGQVRQKTTMHRTRRCTRDATVRRGDQCYCSAHDPDRRRVAHLDKLPDDLQGDILDVTHYMDAPTHRVASWLSRLGDASPSEVVSRLVS